MNQNKSVGVVNVNLGENVTIIQPSNIYGCELKTNNAF